MGDISQAVLLIVALLALLTMGVWVSLALIACGLIGIVVFTDAPAGIIFATKAWDASANWALTALPLFIWMGEILYRTRLAEDMFSGLSPWVRRLPGRLVHVNVLGCGIFAAVSGSSAATAATIGRISLPELKKRENARANESQKLLNWGYAAFDVIKLFDAAQAVDTAPVWKGSARTIALGRTTPIVTIIPTGSRGQLRTELTRQDPLIAPFAKGQAMGTLKVHLGEDLLEEIELVALQDVPQAGLWRRAWDTLRLWIK